MRIPLSRIWRAFPELDRFTDEQCERFVRAACRTGRRHLHRAFLLVLFVVLSVTGFVLGGYVVRILPHRWRPGHPAASPAMDLLAIGVFVLAVFAVMLVRDRLLLRRIRRVIRTRGVCPACRYSLLGMLVGADHAIVCPECGLRCEVDPSLGELVAGEDGSTQYLPAVKTLAPGFWTPSRRRFAKRSAIALAVVVFFVLPGVWGAYELFLWRQAAAAARDRPGVQSMIDFIEAHQPPGANLGDTNAWDFIARAAAIRRDADTRDAEAHPDDYSTWARNVGDFSLIWSDWRVRTDPDLVEVYETNEAIARRLLAAYGEAGAFDALREAASMPRAVPVINFGEDATPLLFMQMEWVIDCRYLVQGCAARMHLALERGDAAEFADALEAALALSRAVSHVPGLLGGLVAVSMEATSLTRLRAMLATQPTGEWLDAAESALHQQQWTIPRGYHVRGEGIAAHDTVAAVFSDRANVRFSRFSLMRESGVFGWYQNVPGRVGIYTENRNAIVPLYAAEAAIVALDPWQRATAQPPPPAPTHLILPNCILPGFGRLHATFDQAEIDRRGLRLLIALERHRLAHGDYPAALADLTPDFLADLPLDPWSGRPFGYVRVDPASDRLGRSFLLYSIGPDLTDDRGRENPLTREGRVLVDQTAPGYTGGFDVIINDGD